MHQVSHSLLTVSTMFADENDGSFFSGGGQLGTSFANLEKKAASDTSRMMADVASQLYDSPIVIASPPPPTASNAEEDHGGFGAGMGMEQFRRFADNEYEAHTDTVQPKELRDWQDSFAFLRVVGTALPSSTHSSGDIDTSSGSGDDVSDYACVPASRVPQEGHGGDSADSGYSADGGAHAKTLDSPSPQSESANELLAVRGSAVLLSPHPHFSADGEDADGGGHVNPYGEEVFMQNGVLVDTLIERHSPQNWAPLGSRAIDEEMNTAVEPSDSQQAEVIGILADAVWPDVVNQLKPLLQLVVQASRPLGLDFYEKQEQEAEHDRARQQESEEQHTNNANESESLFDHGW